MLNVADNNYRQSVTGNANSVRLNAYASNNSNASKLRCVGGDSVLLRTPRFVNAAKSVINAGLVARCVAFVKTMVTGMRGIVKIPSSKVLSFYSVKTMPKLAHHFLSTLKNVDNVAYSGTEFNTFNPFVVGSTPAGPTKKTKKHFVSRYKVLFSWAHVL
jgi:hypothetical protein